MKPQLARLVIGVLEVLIALSAIAGGIALLAGTYQDGVLIEAGGKARFPLEWLQHTPFSDYTIPALILTIGVGGSSLLGAVLVWTFPKAGILASVVAGLIMAGFILVEMLMLGARNLLDGGSVRWAWSAHRFPGLLPLER